MGDMPRSHQVGYVFSEDAKYSDAKTIAHELGHGLYSFEHTFENKGAKQGSTDNLMDYNDGIADKMLKVWQWNLLYTHKNYTVPFLEDDEDAMYKPWSYLGYQLVEKLYDKNDPNQEYFCVLNPKGEKFMLPAKTKNIYFDNCKVLSFQIDDELWVAMLKDHNNFVGYFKDLGVDENFESYLSPAMFNDSKYVNDQKTVTDHIYMPNFYSADDSDCDYYDILKVYDILSTPGFETNKDGLEYIMDPDYSSIYIVLDEVKYEVVSEKNQYNVNCLPYTVKQFYTFMINYYDYFKDNSFAQNWLMSCMLKCKDVIVKGYDDEFQSVLDDFKDENILEYSLSSDKSKDYMHSERFLDFIDAMERKLSHKTIDMLAITFDNWSVYQDYYRANPKGCSKDIWESDLTQLNKIKEAIGSYKINFFDYDKGENVYRKPTVYDFCDHIINMCHDYWHTVEYEILEDYLKTILKECDYETACRKYQFGAAWNQFNDKAEKASLHLMKAIDYNDYDKFHDFLKGNDGKYMTLTQYMHKFDDALFDFWPELFGENRYTGFMKVLVFMYRKNPKAFGANITPSQMDICGYTLSESDEFGITFDETIGRVTFKSVKTDGSGNPIVNLVKVSPFEPVYLTFKKDDPSLVLNVVNGSVEPDDNGNYYLTCPVIFYKYFKDKEFNQTARHIVAGACVAVVIVALAPELIAVGGPSAMKIILEKFGKEKAVDFAVGATVGAISYSLGQYISRRYFENQEDVWKAEDCLYHSMWGGVDNLIDNKYTKIKKYISCVDATDWSNLYSCTTTLVDGKDFFDQKNCPLIKTLLECGAGFILECILQSKSAETLKTNIKNALSDIRLRRKLTDALPFDSYKIELAVYEYILKESNWAAKRLEIIEQYGENGFKILKKANIDYGKFDLSQFESLSKIAKEANEEQMTNMEKLLAGSESDNFIFFLEYFNTYGLDVAEFMSIVDKITKLKIDYDNLAKSEFESFSKIIAEASESQLTKMEKMFINELERDNFRFFLDFYKLYPESLSTKEFLSLIDDAIPKLKTLDLKLSNGSVTSASELLKGFKTNEEFHAFYKILEANNMELAYRIESSEKYVVIKLLKNSVKSGLSVTSVKLADRLDALFEKKIISK